MRMTSSANPRLRAFIACGAILCALAPVDARHLSRSLSLSLSLSSVALSPALFLLAAFIHSSYAADYFFQGPGSARFFSKGFGGSPLGRTSPDNEYYDILGVPRTAPEKDIKRAYRRLAIKMHPDKGGDEQQFKKLTEAYDVLSNPQKRSVYDTYGKAGLTGVAGDEGMGARGMEDILGAFFGRSRGPRKTEDSIYRLEVTLEDLYMGGVKKLRMATVKAVQGTLVRQPKILEVKIEPGMGAGERIVLRGEIDDGLGGIPGDVIFILKEKPHSSFVRRGSDLVTTLDITLSEALLGFQRPITHLDGSMLWVKSPSDFVCAPDRPLCVRDAGMPLRTNERSYARTHGNLFVRTNVIFPEKLNAKGTDKDVLRAVFGPPRYMGPGFEAAITGDPEALRNEKVHELQPVDAASFRMHFTDSMDNEGHEPYVNDEFLRQDDLRCAQQ